MSSWYFKRLYTRLAACVLVLQVFGCRDLGKFEDHFAQSKHSAQSKHTAQSKAKPPAESKHSAESRHSAKSKHSAHPDQSEHSAEATKKNEAPDDTLQGACSQADRDKHIHDNNQKFIDGLKACSKETWAKKAKNVACLAKTMPSLSQECAGCFADMASCSLDNCKMACMLDSTSNKCINCGNSHCQASLIKCAGVARVDLP